MGSQTSKASPDDLVQLSHFRLVKVIGRGAFGKVYMARHRTQNVSYALKCMSKDRCIHMDALRNIIRERTILEQLDHPLVCNMRFAFQDTTFMYMAMDLMLGGDLRGYLAHHSASEPTIRFWITELVCAVQYLHSRGVVHRDIKPDNILLDKDGHIHLSDFNIACTLPKDRLLTSKSGTLAYFAPEVFRGSGYTESVDWWAIGITFYECVYGRRPWQGCENTDELAANVLRGNIRYPEPVIPVSKPCVSAIQGFLQRQPLERLGYRTSGWTALVQHDFFHAVDWLAVENKAQNPPSCQVMETRWQSDRVDSTASSVSLILEESRHSIDQERDGAGGDAGGGGWGWFRPPPKTTKKYEQAQRWIWQEFRDFDYTIYEQYQGFLDPERRTVGPPPEWVKPAFADSEQWDTQADGSDPTTGTGVESVAGADNKTDLQTKGMMDAAHLRLMISPIVRSSRTDSVYTLGSLVDDGSPMYQHRKRSSAQSFRERREREKRQSAYEARRLSASSLIASIY